MAEPRTAESTDAELDALAVELERLGLLERHTQADGRTGYRLTAQGSVVARRLALTGDTGVLDAFLGAR